jgi:hypothetical protein
MSFSCFIESIYRPVRTTVQAGDSGVALERPAIAFRLVSPTRSRLTCGNVSESPDRRQSKKFRSFSIVADFRPFNALVIGNSCLDLLIRRTGDISKIPVISDVINHFWGRIIPNRCFMICLDSLIMPAWIMTIPRWSGSVQNSRVFSSGFKVLGARFGSSVSNPSTWPGFSRRMNFISGRLRRQIISSMRSIKSWNWD